VRLSSTTSQLHVKKGHSDDYTGQVFGRLTVLERVAERRVKTKYLCRCSCGNLLHVKSNSLATGHTRSCGCLNLESIRARVTKHGGTGSPEYQAFKGMWRRCTDPKDKNYQDYKDRTPPPEWRDFGVFLLEVGLKPGLDYSLDRIDNERPYGPGNVRWATSFEQANNTRKNVTLSVDGVEMTVAQMARHIEVPADVIYGRLRRGWTKEKTVSTLYDGTHVRK